MDYIDSSLFSRSAEGRGEPEQERLRIGLIGCGGMGCHHARQLASMDAVELVATMDIIPEKADLVAQESGAKSYASYTEFLDGVDAVWLCTPPSVRLEVIKRCAEAGVHVFCEKPIALSLDEANAIVDVVQQSGIIFMLGYVLRFTQPYRYLQDLYASGALGDLITCWTRRFMPVDMSNRWFGDEKQSGGVLLDFGSHDIDLLLWKGGAVRTVLAGTRRVRTTMRADEHGQALMIFESGAMGTVDVSWWSPLRECSLGVVGTRGAASMGADNTVRVTLDGTEERRLTLDDPELAPVETEHAYFFRCVREGIQPMIGAQEGRDLLAVVLAAQESARTGHSVDL